MLLVSAWDLVRQKIGEVMWPGVWGGWVRFMTTTGLSCSDSDVRVENEETV